MDFTREPIIETVITPKDGWTLVVRSSKNAGQEEYFVDAVEVITFGGAVFFRSRERPKSFMVPVSDYEVLEVRETRLVLKNVGIDRSIKIGGGREGAKNVKEPVSEKSDRQQQQLPSPLSAPQIPALTEAEAAPEGETSSQETVSDAKEGRLDKRRERKRNYRRKRARDGVAFREEEASGEDTGAGEEEGSNEGALQPVTSVISSLLPPPPTLISETISRYKDNALFKGAFFLKDEHQNVEAVDESNDENEKIAIPSDVQDKAFDDLLDIVEVPQMSLDFPIYEALEPKENTALHVAEYAEEEAGVAEAFVKAAEEAENSESQDAIQEAKEDDEVKFVSQSEILEHFQKRIEESVVVHSESEAIVHHHEESESFSEQRVESSFLQDEKPALHLPIENPLHREDDNHQQAQSDNLYPGEDSSEDVKGDEAISSLHTQEQLEWIFDTELEKKGAKKPKDSL